MFGGAPDDLMHHDPASTDGRVLRAGAGTRARVKTAFGEAVTAPVGGAVS
jgi:hypothetical protein